MSLLSRLQARCLQRRSQAKRSQEEIFSTYGWWDKSCLLLQITDERCDYIESRIDRVFGRGALHQQEILEVGCGGGLIADTLARRKALIFGIDPAAGALATARAHLQESNLGQNAYFQQCCAESLPYADGSFSVIVCLDVLEHVRDLNATIGEIARVLAPGGVFIFDTINRTLTARLVLIWLGEALGARFPKMGLVPGIHQYEAFIKPRELRQLLTTHGLLVQEMTGFMPRGFKRGGIKLGPGPFMGISYIGYATKVDAGAGSSGKPTPLRSRMRSRKSVARSAKFRRGGRNSRKNLLPNQVHEHLLHHCILPIFILHIIHKLER